MKIRPVGTEVLYVDRGTDRRDEVNSSFCEILPKCPKIAS